MNAASPDRVRSGSLSGVRVLVGRARHQAGSLSSDLRRRGAEVIEIPFIEIRKPRSFKPLVLALKNLGNSDWLIMIIATGDGAGHQESDRAAWSQSRRCS